MNDDVLDRLMHEVFRRVKEMPEGSYTSALIRGGLPKMAAKIREESEEVIEAAGETGTDGQQHLTREACDLIYHLWVLLGSRGITVDDLRQELTRREGVSGLQEKAQRLK